MNRKVAVISMVRNEADIIESFVRHCFSFADVVLVRDHMSVDATADILKKLQAEGLPLQVESVESVEQVQAEVMTDLMETAFRNENADLVLPLDADEFLVSKSEYSSYNCHQKLRELAIDRVYAVSWIKHLLKSPDTETDKFILERSVWREKYAEPLHKVIIGREAFQNMRLQLIQGNHAACIASPAGLQAIIPEAISDIYIAHFFWRGEFQAASKAVVGWVSNIAKYSPFTNMANHWHHDFQRLIEKKQILAPKLKNYESGEKFSCTDAAGQKIVLKYTCGKIDPFFNLALAAEQLAGAYAMQRTLVKHLVVSFLVVFQGDIGELMHSLQNIQAQSYPYYEVIILDFCGNSDAILEEICSKNHMSLMKATGATDWAKEISLHTYGHYVQWMFPGYEISSDKVLKMVEAMDTQPNVTFAVSDIGLESDSKILDKLDLGIKLGTGGETFVLGEGAVLWKYILEQGKVWPGGIYTALFRRETMERFQWLRECFVDGRMLNFSILNKILSNSVIGGFSECLVTSYRQLFRSGDIILLQLEWFYILQEYRTREYGITEDVYREALQLLLQRKIQIQAFLKDVPSELESAYQQVAQQAKKILNE